MVVLPGLRVRILWQRMGARRFSIYSCVWSIEQGSLFTGMRYSYGCRKDVCSKGGRMMSRERLFDVLWCVILCAPICVVVDQLLSHFLGF